MTAVRRLSSVHEVPVADWQALVGAANPFASHAFLSALEDAGAIGPGTAWEPQHLVLEDDGGIAGILPLYLKHDSYGEFVFDWAWADAWHRAGRRYYPKLVAATPYSPVTAPKVLVRPAADPATALIPAAMATAEGLGASSLHWLFVDEALASSLVAAGHALRHDCQYHWQNAGYADFDAFLARFRSAKRKELKRERKRVAETGLVIRHHAGSTVDAALWERLHALTARSFWLRGGAPYLDVACYRLLGERLGDAVHAFVAWDGDRPIACALFLEGDGALFGRYWGAEVEVPGLHFELCYYRAIEYCIERGLQRFEPGAQGEHKLARGFDPVRTTSAHWIAEAALRAPIGEWCRRERAMVTRYIEAARGHLPFRRE